jgi:hypothetical protein
MLIRFYKTLSEILLLFTLSKLKLFFKFEIHAKRINPNLYYVPWITDIALRIPIS